MVGKKECANLFKGGDLKGGGNAPPIFQTRKTFRKHFGANKLSNIWKSQLIKSQLKKTLTSWSFLVFSFSGFAYQLLLLLRMVETVNCLHHDIISRPKHTWQDIKN